MYSPNFSELAAVSIRRLAWAMGANMGQAVDVLVKALPAFIDTQKVCELCKDKSKCSVCACKSGGKMPDKALGLLYSEVLQ
jgi:recombinational DNA repair protein RecR